MKSSERKSKRAESISPLRAALNAIRAELKTAAERLQFDISNKNWLKLVSAESFTYPCTLDGESWEFLKLLPEPALARIRALELIEGLEESVTDMEEQVRNCDDLLTELRAELAADPAPMTISTYLKQVEEAA